VDTWRAGETDDVIFDVNRSRRHPVENFIALQLNPLFGWTEPIPMWKLSRSLAYILYSPRDLQELELSLLPQRAMRLCR